MGLIIVGNTKGGSGKSTTSIQFLGPWLLSRTGHSTIIELDDQNNDTKDYYSSKIDMEQFRIGSESTSHHVLEDLMERALTGQSIVDLGGNRTCEMALKGIGELYIGDEIDLIVIPVSSSGKDVDNAEKTIKIIRDYIPKYKGDIVLVITRAPSTNEGALEREIPDAYWMQEGYDLKGPIILPQDKSFALSRFLHTTAWEVSKQKEMLEESFAKRAAEARKEGNISEGVKIRRTQSILSASVRMAAYLEGEFQKMDAILPLDTSEAENAKDKQADQTD